MSLVRISDLGVLLWAARMNLPGTLQTVPRAEYFAFLYLCQRAIPGSTILYMTDHLPLKKTFYGGWVAAHKAQNADLIVPALKAIEEKELIVDIKWMPSHIASDIIGPIPYNLSRIDLLGNQHADAHAKAAAKLHEISLNLSSKVLYYANLVRRIQKRLATIICSLPHRPQTPNPPPCPMEGLDDLMAVSDHVCFEQLGRVSCARCFNSLSLTHKSSLKDWLKTKCTHINCNSDRPVPLSYDAIHIGRLRVHSSHRTCIYKGLVYCGKCGGAYTQKSKLGNLAEPCTTPTLYGRNNLSRLSAGELPYYLTHWPNGDNSTRKLV